MTDTNQILERVKKIIEELDQHGFESCSLARAKTNLASCSMMSEGASKKNTARDTLSLANMALAKFFRSELEKAQTYMDPGDFTDMALDLFNKMKGKEVTPESSAGEMLVLT